MQFFHNSKVVKKPILNIASIKKATRRAEHEFQILVETISGKTTTLDVRTDDTIGQVKVKIYFKMEQRIPMDLQYLTFQSKMLVSSNIYGSFKLIDYNVQKNDTIRLGVRLRGGGKRARTSASEDIIPKFIGVPEVKDIYHIIIIHIYR